ncbi:MAG: Gfo/Idh/MocA family oxidoreductase [Pseudomonadota bacterium]
MTRVAVVGAGYFGQFHYDAWARMDDVELVACAAPEGAREAAEKYAIPAVYDDAAAMIADTKPDLIDITSPPATHLDVLQTAAGQVPWAICQKPFCGGLEGGRQAVSLAQSAGLQIAVHENFRFQPWHREIKRLLDTTTLGTPYQVSFRLRPGDGQGPDAYLSRQPYFQQMPRFLIHETGVHFVDVFRYLMGEVRAVSARLTRLNPAIAGEDAGIVEFEFTNHQRGLFDGNRLASHAAQNRRLTMGEMEIDGPKGSLRLDGDGGIWLRAHDANEWTRHDYGWPDQGFAGDCVYATNRAALGAFRAGTPPENEASAYLRNVEIVEAIYQSDRERRWIDVRVDA